MHEGESYPPVSCFPGEWLLGACGAGEGTRAGVEEGEGVSGEISKSFTAAVASSTPAACARPQWFAQMNSEVPLVALVHCYCMLPYHMMGN